MLIGAQTAPRRLAANHVCRHASELRMNTTSRSPRSQARAAQARGEPADVGVELGERDLPAVDAQEGLLGPGRHGALERGVERLRHGGSGTR